MKGFTFLNATILLLVIFALSCARQTTPTGGPKDSIPPRLVRAVPHDQQINYQAQQLELTFSEAVQLNNPKEQLIITPGVGKDFQATVRKNRVVITLEQSLQPNTTYTVNFREAVQDITEKNPAQNLRIAFSTGTYIDSLHLSGNVYELLAGKEAKDATVALYQQDTINIFRHKPSYLTKTDDLGNFHIDNLKPGYYRIYAWYDNNKNLIVDSRSESYGFITEHINPALENESLDIPLIRLDTRPLKLTSARPSQTFFNIKASKNVDAYGISAQDNIPIYSSFGDDHENIRIYNTFGLAASDSIQVKFTARDSILQTIDTTLYVKFAQRAIKPAPFQFSNEAFSVSGLTGQLTGVLLFNKPVVHLNYDSITYRIDSVHQVRITAEDLTYDSTRTRLTFTKQLDKTLLQPKAPAKTTASQTTRGAANEQPQLSPGASKKTAPRKRIVNDYELLLGYGAFISAEGDSTKAGSIPLKPTTMETTGVVILEIKTSQQNLLVQLLARGKVIASQYATTKATFSDLPPGDYAIRVVVDSDRDGRWSPGNYYINKAPEAVYFYRNEQGAPTITLKANWERELLITF